MNTFEERRTTGMVPWMFYSNENCEHTFYSLSERRLHNKHIKEIIDNDIVCSLHGWFVLSDQNDRRSCQLLNPVSMATIQLPLFSRPCYFDFCALSCDPNNPNCIVMLIKVEQGTATCYFCRPGDVIWNEKDLEFEKRELCFDSIRTVGCYKDQICIFTSFDKILVLAADPPYLIVTDLGVELIPRFTKHYGTSEHHLVESDGELFVIWRLDIRIDAYDFVVCKLDISGKKRLVAVDDLGGRAFFLSSSSSEITCSAGNYGIKANTIYFTQTPDPRIYSFDLQKKVLTFSLPCPNMRRNLVFAEWILPLSPNTPCKLDCKVDIISPLQIKKSTILPPSISFSIGKDWSGLPDDTSNSVAKKLSSRFTSSDWSELPHDMLISIAEKCSSVTCARIATVCKSWESSITWAPKKLLGCPTFLHMPSASIEVFHFMNKSRYYVPVSENPEVLSIQHAKYGWLLMTRYGGHEIFFLNPLTAEKIEIPDLPEAQIRGFCFTSLPTSSSCSVFAICDGISHSSVYHIHRGVMEWIEVEIPEFEAIVGDFELTPYSNPVFHRGVFYWISVCGNLCTYDSTKGHVEFLVEPQSPCKSIYISYLFENGEKLMSVCAGRHGKWVRVYELDEASMVWKEVSSLDEKVVFLSRNSSIVTEMQGLEDMICFNRFVGDYKPLIYSLKTREFGVYGSGHHVIKNFCDIPEYQIKSAWIKPNVKQHSVRELTWNDVLINISQLSVTD